MESKLKLEESYIPQLQDRLLYDDHTMPTGNDEQIKEWIPEDFNFICVRPERRDIFVKGRFELRRLPRHTWLMRKKAKNERSNTEFLVKFYMVIHPLEVEFARQLLTIGLR